MKYLLGFLTLICSPAIAADYVYVYYAGGNVGYTCHKLPSYLTTESNSRLDFDKCDVQFTDEVLWPTFPPLPARLTLSGPAFKQPESRVCSFVAQANGSGDTSTVFDCRSGTGDQPW